MHRANERFDLVVALVWVVRVVSVAAVVAGAIGFPFIPLPSKTDGDQLGVESERFSAALQAWNTHDGWRHSTASAWWTLSAVALFAASRGVNWDRARWKTWWIVGAQMLIPAFAVAGLPNLLGAPPSNYDSAVELGGDDWLYATGTFGGSYVVIGLVWVVAHRVDQRRRARAEPVRKTLDHPAERAAVVERSRQRKRIAGAMSSGRRLLCDEPCDCGAPIDADRARIRVGAGGLADARGVRLMLRMLSGMLSAVRWAGRQLWRAGKAVVDAVLNMLPLP